MLSCKGTLYLICLTLLVASLQSERPQLTNNRVPLEATVESKRYEYLLTTLEFDQDLYVNEAFVCAGQEVDCTPSACVPCDWSGESVCIFFFFFFFHFFHITNIDSLL